MALVMYDLCGIDESLRFSPFCWRAKLAIAHKGLEVEARPWCFTEKEKLEFTDHDKVPVLIDGDEVITDSFEILRYLDRAYPDAPTLLDYGTVGVGRTERKFFTLRNTGSVPIDLVVDLRDKWADRVNDVRASGPRSF